MVTVPFCSLDWDALRFEIVLASDNFMRKRNREREREEKKRKKKREPCWCTFYPHELHKKLS